MRKIYRLEDGRLWDIQGGRYIQAGQLEVGSEILELHNADGEADQTYLIKTLKFYGHELGALEALEEEGLKDMLAELDAEYLPPRTLAGLATGDAEALARWQEHEAKAAPLREQLAQLCES